jgi:hypothetical protein
MAKETWKVRIRQRVLSEFLTLVMEPLVVGAE